MNVSHDMMRDILAAVQRGELDVEQAAGRLQDKGYVDLGHTKFDMHRVKRNGFPEVVYAEGKTAEQVGDIFESLKGESNVLATRVSPEMAAYVLRRCPHVRHNALGRTLASTCKDITPKPGEVAVVTAGTSDLPVAEEARVTCEMFGTRVRVFSDVGVAGIHRLFDRLEDIRRADVVIVVAGMEGALASVVGGLVSGPVVAVPTSVGYGAALSGFSALLCMLNSCASGVTVVNIDNGFGAACAACRICSLNI
jgi:NCAIR mutase (PurE)-related protein